VGVAPHLASPKSAVQRGAARRPITVFHRSAFDRTSKTAMFFSGRASAM
jgi:hypothetical protein